MKKLFSFLAFCLMLTLLISILTGCGHHRDGTSVWAEGLWLVLVPFAGVAVWFFYQAYKAHDSGGIQQIPGGQKYDDDKTPYHKIPQFWLGIACVVADIVIALMVNADK